MPNSMMNFGFVKKSGDTMTGSLTIKGNLYLRDPLDNIRGGMLMPHPLADGIVLLRTLDDSDYGQLYGEWMPRMITQHCTVVSHTGDTDETTLYDLPIYGGMLYQNGVVHARYFIHATGVGGVKTYRLKLSGELIKALTIPAEANHYNCIDLSIQNDGAWDEQKCSVGLLFSDNVGEVDISTSQNTATTRTLRLTGQLADAGDTVKACALFAWLSEKGT